MSQMYIKIIFLLMWGCLIFNYWIQTKRIIDIKKRLSRLELVEYFKNNIEIKEEKEEKTLQKKDKEV